MRFFLLLVLLAGCAPYSCDIDKAFSDVAPVVEQANSAFAKAEEKILKIVPEVVDDTHPDPNKCICKGTGIIRQGDGHTTICPYHGKSTDVIKR